MPVSPAGKRSDSVCSYRHKERRLEPLVTLASRDYGRWLNAATPSPGTNKSPPVFQTEKKRVHWRK